MLKQYGWLCGVLGGVLAVAGPGCGGAGLGPVKVNGKITLDNAPLAGANVTFVPQVTAGGQPASGRTDSAGAFDLTTFHSGDGALPGEYKVIVTYQEDNPPRKEVNAMSDKEKEAFFMKVGAKARKKKASPVPEVYGSVDKTPLKWTVPAGGRVELNLKSTAR
jgi:hypothetical protein